MRIIIFSSSYGFIFVLVLCTAFVSEKQPWLLLSFLISLFIWIVSIIVYLYLLHQFTRLSKEEIQVGVISKSDENIAEYIVAYLLPFAFASISSFVDLIILLIVIFFIGLIILNTDMLYYNPILILFGYNYFEVEDITNTVKVNVIIKKNTLINIKHGFKLKMIHIDYDTYLGVM